MDEAGIYKLIFDGRQTLPAFLRANLSSDIRRANFVIALEYLQNVLEKVDMPIQETSIMALGRLAE